eukprot:6173587-Pleurochrysis_carterae.AAC.3
MKAVPPTYRLLKQEPTLKLMEAGFSSMLFKCKAGSAQTRRPRSTKQTARRLIRAALDELGGGGGDGTASFETGSCADS